MSSRGCPRPGLDATPPNDGRLARERAEILRLITQLTARRVVNQEKERQRRSRPTMPAPRGSEAEIRAPRRRTNASRPPSSLPQSGLTTLLQSMEARLARLEERLNHRRSSRPSPPAKSEGPELGAATFSGVIQGQMLSDMLQLVSSNDLNGVFVVDNGGSQCRLFFQLGRICHAEAPGLKGEEAFFAAFGADTGRYWFIESEEAPPEKTIDSATQFLILEALRRIDESRA